MKKEYEDIYLAFKDIIDYLTLEIPLKIIFQVIKNYIKKESD